MTKKSIEYLAAPYTHPNKKVEALRYELITLAAGNLVLQGRCIYSPITHCHPMAMKLDLPTEYSFWKDYDEAFIRISSKFLLLMLPQWASSKGVDSDLNYAKSLGISIEPTSPFDVGITEDMLCQLANLQSEKGS